MIYKLISVSLYSPPLYHQFKFCIFYFGNVLVKLRTRRFIWGDPPLVLLYEMKGKKKQEMFILHYTSFFPSCYYLFFLMFFFLCFTQQFWQIFSCFSFFLIRRALLSRPTIERRYQQKKLILNLRLDISLFKHVSLFLYFFPPYKIIVWVFKCIDLERDEFWDTIFFFLLILLEFRIDLMHVLLAMIIFSYNTTLADGLFDSEPTYRG